MTNKQIDLPLRMNKWCSISQWMFIYVAS